MLLWTLDELYCTSDVEDRPLLTVLFAHVCVHKGERSVVKSLVATYGVDCRDSQGRTPLMYAVIGESDVQYSVYVYMWLGNPLLCAVVCVCVCMGVCSVLAADKSKCCETLLRLGADPNSLDGETNATCVIECSSCLPSPSLTSLSPTPLFPSPTPPLPSPPPLTYIPQSMDALHCCGPPITATRTQCAPSSNPMTPIRTLLTLMAELVSRHVNIVVCIWREHTYVHTCVSTSTVYTGTYIHTYCIYIYVHTLIHSM